jgi:HME family heavy-metal exporter
MADRAYVGKFVKRASGRSRAPVLEGERRFDLLVRLEEPYRTDYANLGRLRLELPDKRQVMLSELADIGPGTGPSQIQRENARRRIIVRCNARDRALQAVVADVESRIKDRVSLPKVTRSTWRAKHGRSDGPPSNPRPCDSCRLSACSSFC